MPVSLWYHNILTNMVLTLTIYIYPDDVNRVKLSGGPQPGSDYINASFIDVSNTHYMLEYNVVLELVHISLLYRVISTVELTLQHKVHCRTQ